MQTVFYFDPACPWCWVTSRWLLMSGNERDIDVEWRLFSLAYKNGELDGKHSANDHMPSHRVERVMLEASKRGAKMIDLYTAFGIKHFLGGEDYTNETIAAVLEQLKLDPDLLQAADSKELDKELIESSQTALKIVGDDIGVPTIAFTDKQGKQTGFFGPVLKELPDQAAATKLWDSIVDLAQNDGFYELKRGRNGGPDVYSTAKC